VSNRPRRAVAVVAATLLALALVPVFLQSGSSASAAPARIAAQTCQYPSDCGTTTTAATTPGNPGCDNGHAGGHNPNCTTTTTARPPAPGNQLVIILDVHSGSDGALVQAVICNAPPGIDVKITFNGVVVADVTTAPGTCPSPPALGRSGSGPVLAVLGPLGGALNGRVQAQTGSGEAVASFRVPSDAPDGTYPVCAVSAGMSSGCSNFTVQNGASVLGTSFTNGGAPLVSSSNGDSFLAFTGLGLIRLLLLAGVLIAVGVFFVRRGQQRHA